MSRSTGALTTASSRPASPGPAMRATWDVASSVEFACPTCAELTRIGM